MSIISSIGYINFNVAQDKGRDAKRKQDLKAVRTALVSYYQDNGQYPPPCSPTCSDTQIPSNPVNQNDWIPGLVPDYIKELPKDPHQALAPFGAGQAGVFGGLAQTFRNFMGGVIPQRAPSQGQVAGISTTTSSTTTAGNVSSWSWNHTINNSGEVLIVGVSYDSTTRFVSFITFAGQNLSYINKASGSRAGAEMWYLKNPPTGTNTISVTFSSSIGELAAGAVSYTGVDLTSPLGISQTATGNSTTPTVNVTSASGELVVDVVGIDATNSSTFSPGAGQTTQFLANAPSRQKGASSAEPGGSSVTMSWTSSTSNGWGIVAVPLKPAGGATPAPTPTSTPTPTPAPTPTPTSTPSGPPPVAGACANLDNYYCYFVSADRLYFSLWAKLDNKDDPETVTKTGVYCGGRPIGNWNFCVESPQ